VPGRKSSLRAALLVVLAVQVLVWIRLAPPAALPATAPATAFSAGRAIATLRERLGAEQPRPTRSAANARLRAGIVEGLQQLGYEPSVQTGKTKPGRPFALHNLYAERAGTLGEAAPLILLTAHHDSVAWGPGAADDGAGVATLLEVARWLTTCPPSRNAIGLLFTDGEEIGLHGAGLFVDEHPALARVAIVLNFEARGVRGPSLMFETFGGDRAAIAHFAAADARPLGTSLFATIYRQMPNDTDLTVFGRAGKRGMNFAFLGGAEHYHRASDTLANLDPGSVQHHGDHATAMLLALADVDFGAWTGSDAVFFDVLGFVLVHWPQALTPLLAVAIVALLLLARRRGLPAASRWERVRVDLLLPLLLLLGGGFGYGLTAAMTSLGILTTDFPDPAWPPVAAYWLGSLVALWVVGRVARRVPLRRIHDELWLRLCLIGLVLSFLLPGASYLVLVPAGVGALVAVVSAFVVPAERALRCAHLLSILCAAVLWLPPLDLLSVTLGARAGLVAGLAQALFLSVLLPLCAAADERPAPEYNPRPAV
jgi:hypothetical protein